MTPERKELFDLFCQMHEGWLPDAGKVYTVTLTGMQRDVLMGMFALPEERSADAIPMPKEWIEAAKCPNCGGVGWRAIQVEAGVFEQEQCQWCFEQWLALGQPSLLPQVSE